MAPHFISTAELIARKDWDEVAHQLSSLEYVELMANTGRVFELIADFDEAVAALPSTHPASDVLPVLGGSLRRSANFIARYPSATLQSFWNACWWHDCPDLEDFAEAFSSHSPTRMRSRVAAGPVSRLLQLWRFEKMRGGTPSYWVRSLLPPTTSFPSQMRLEIPIHTDTSRPAALRWSDGKIIVWFQETRNIAEPRAWSCQTGKPISDAVTKTQRFPDPASSGDGKLTVSFGGEGGGWGKPVTVSDAGTGERIASFPIDDDHNISDATLSDDGKFVAAGGYGCDCEGYVYVLDLQSRSLRAFVQLPTSIYSVAFSPNADEIAAGSSDGDIHICSVKNAVVRQSIRAHEAGIICTAFSEDARSLASISHDGTLRIWDLTAAPAETRFAPHPDNVVEARFSPSGDRLVTRSSNGTTWLWDGSTGKPIRCLHASSSIVQMGGDSRTCLLVGNHMIVSVANGGGVWTSVDGTRLGSITDRVYLGRSICFTSDGKKYALWKNGREDNDVIAIRPVRTADPGKRGTEEDVFDGEIDSDGGHFVTTMTADGDFQTRRIPQQVELARILAHEEGVACCAFSADNTLLVSGGVDDVVKVWEWETATEIFSARLDADKRTKAAHHSGLWHQPLPAIREVKFLDEHRIAAVIGGVEVLVWDIRTGSQVEKVAWAGTLDEYSRRPPYLATVRGDQVCIVKTESGEEVAWFPCGRDLVSKLRLIAHPSGRSWVGLLGERFFHFVLESNFSIEGQS